MSGEPLNYDGNIYKLERGFTLRFNPVRSHIPIHIASVTPKSVKQTAEIADGWIPIFFPKEQWEPQLAEFYKYVDNAGRARTDIDVRNPGGITVTDNPERVRMGTAANAAFYIARMGDFYYEHFSRMGYADEANAVRRAWEDGGSSAGAAAMPEEIVNSLGVAGSTGECIDYIEEATEAGFDLHGVSVNEADPHKRFEAFKELVG